MPIFVNSLAQGGSPMGTGLEMEAQVSSWHLAVRAIPKHPRGPLVPSGGRQKSILILQADVCICKCPEKPTALNQIQRMFMEGLPMPSAFTEIPSFHTHDNSGRQILFQGHLYSERVNNLPKVTRVVTVSFLVYIWAF